MIKALLTIDDISSENTTAIVDYLVEKGITAIMFAWGENVERLPEAAEYALKKGMIVGNHSYSHPHFSELSFEEYVNEIEKNEEILNKIYQSAGVERKYRPFRFPYGDKGGDNKEALQKYLFEKGFDKVDDTKIPFKSWKENGLYSHEYIYKHLTKCCSKLKVYMMTCGLKQAKATSAIADFKKWMKACME